MTRNINAEIIAIGTEILLGELTDTNSVYLARVLRDMGINLYFMTSVGDNERRIESAIRIALSRADVVITCGGLGPTVDDMTRQAVAAATDRGLTFHQWLLDQIAARFAGFRSQMTENNKRQAYTPDNAVIIENPVGTAPSFAVEVGEKVVISLPGVPREMKFLMMEKIVPYLREHYGLVQEIIKARTLHVAGVGESALDDMIGNELLTGSNPTIGLNAHSGRIDVRVTAKADTETEANAMIDQTVAVLQTRIGEHIYGVDEMTLEAALIEALQQSGIRLTTAEAGVSTDMQKRLQAQANAANVLGETQQFATLEELTAKLNLDRSLPMRTLAEQAAGALSNDAGQAALVILSTPDEHADSADTAERTSVAVVLGDKVHSRVYGFGSGSDTAREWTVTWTMAMLWRLLKEQARA